MEVSFRRYISEVLRLRSEDYYVQSVNTASRILREAGVRINSLFDVSSLSELRDLRTRLEREPEYIERNTIGHNMFSVGVNHFADFLGLEKFETAAEPARILTCEDIAKLDAPVQRPVQVPCVTYGWNRDRVVVEQVLKADMWQCEIGAAHKTFVARKNDQPYLEGHHLIPLSKQDQFNKSLDVYANIIGLCPNCHRQHHFGKQSEIRTMLKPIYNSRAERLANSGINISKDEFLTLAAG